MAPYVRKEEDEEVPTKSAIDEELSDLAVDLLLLSQELINTKLKLESLSKAGWMHMAKARYIMGPSSVSVLQLPTPDLEKPISASATLDVSQCQRNGGNVRYNYYSVSTPSSPTDDQNSTDGIRLRKFDISELSEETAGGSKVENLAAAGTKKNDPIRWFGFMPPMPLRQSQTHFQSAVDTVVEIANIQSEIRGVEDRIKFLERTKGKVEKDNVEDTVVTQREEDIAIDGLNIN